MLVAIVLTHIRVYSCHKWEIMNSMKYSNVGVEDKIKKVFFLSSALRILIKESKVTNC